MAKFSICIPAYKSRFLDECIHSILVQSISDFELIILNDCSPNPVEIIVNSFSDKRIKYYSNNQNVGPINLVQNWNKCLELASGEYLIMMGDDDLMEASYLSVFSDLIEKYSDLDVYHCRSKIIDDAGNINMLTPSWPEYENVYDNIWHRLTERRAQYISDFVYKVSSLRKSGGFYNLPYAWGSDDITSYIACGNKGIAHTNKSVFRYRSNELSITKTGNDIVKMDANILYAKWLFEFLYEGSPDNSDAGIMHSKLLVDSNKLMQKRKIHIMSKSLSTNKLQNYIMWLGLRKKYAISIMEISYALIIALKEGRSKIRY